MPEDSPKDNALDKDKALDIIKKWLEASALTATNKQFEEHFNLISKKVKVTGVQGFDSISYDDWARQTQQDFKDDTLKGVSYEGLKLQATNENQIMFKTVETIFVNDGSHKAHGVEILLTQEEDGVWRVTQERVLADAESIHDGLMIRVDERK